MVVAGGGEQHRFRLGPERLGRAREQNMAHDFGAGGAAGLTRELHANAERFQLERQHGGLGRFAGPLPAFERNELSLHQANPIRAARIVAARTSTIAKGGKLPSFQPVAALYCERARARQPAHTALLCRLRIAAQPRHQLHHSRFTPARNRPIMSSVAASIARCDMLPLPMSSAAFSGTSRARFSPRQTLSLPMLCPLLTVAGTGPAYTR